MPESTSSGNVTSAARRRQPAWLQALMALLFLGAGVLSLRSVALGHGDLPLVLGGVQLVAGGLAAGELLGRRRHEANREGDQNVTDVRSSPTVKTPS